MVVWVKEKTSRLARYAPPSLTYPSTTPLIRGNHHYLQFLKIAQEAQTVCAKYSIPPIIDDCLDIAFAVNATGVHLGQTDMPLSVARSLLPPHMVRGASVNSIQEPRWS